MSAFVGELTASVPVAVGATGGVVRSTTRTGGVVGSTTRTAGAVFGAGTGFGFDTAMTGADTSVGSNGEVAAITAFGAYCDLNVFECTRITNKPATAARAAKLTRARGGLLASFSSLLI